MFLCLGKYPTEDLLSPSLPFYARLLEAELLSRLQSASFSLFSLFVERRRRWARLTSPLRATCHEQQPRALFPDFKSTHDRCAVGRPQTSGRCVATVSQCDDRCLQLEPRIYSARTINISVLDWWGERGSRALVWVVKSSSGSPLWEQYVQTNALGW